MVVTMIAHLGGFFVAPPTGDYFGNDGIECLEDFYQETEGNRDEFAWVSRLGWLCRVSGAALTGPPPIIRKIPGVCFPCVTKGAVMPIIS